MTSSLLNIPIIELGIPFRPRSELRNLRWTRECKINP